MTVNPYLLFQGNCREAFEYYAKLTGGNIEAMLANSQAPEGMPVAPGQENQIMHARMSMGDSILMASDCPPEYQKEPQGFSVSLTVDTVPEAKRIFDGLADGGSVGMPFEETFWAAGFGMVVDRFGIPWMVSGAPKEVG